MSEQGADIALTYQNERLKPRVEKFAEQLDASFVAQCDVSADVEIENLSAAVRQHWDYLDIAVHSIAYAPREQLEGLYLDSVDRTGFLAAHEISSYSFSAIAKALSPMMLDRNAAFLTLTYIWLGSFDAEL